MPSTAPKPQDTAQAVKRGVQISPKKLNQFATLVRRLHVDEALAQCQLSVLKAARICEKVGNRFWLCLHWFGENQALPCCSGRPCSMPHVDGR